MKEQIISKVMSAGFIMLFVGMTWADVGTYSPGSVVRWDLPLLIFCLLFIPWLLGYMSANKNINN